MEEKQLYGHLTVYRERGAYLRRLEQFEKSKASYDTALEGTPDDVRTLVGRSRVCSDAVQPKQAFTDAELALGLEPNNMTARCTQARASVTTGDFERALVMNYRGERVRRRPNYFVEGVGQCTEIIEDCIGVNAGNIMVESLPLIRSSEKTLATDAGSQRPSRVSRIPKPPQRRQLTQAEARRHLCLSRVLAMKYIGPMASDKFFLQQLAQDSRLRSANAAGSRELQATVTEALRSLTERQEMLRTQRPYYTIKLAEKVESKHQVAYDDEVLKRKRDILTRISERLMSQIERCLAERRISDLMTNAERLQVFLDGNSPHLLPDKEQCTDKLYRLVGEGYLALYRLSQRLSDRGNRRRVAFLMGMPCGRPSSFDSVISTYPFKFSDARKATEKLIAALDTCENATMRCWLAYELSRLLCAQKNYALAKFHAKRCQEEALEVENGAWWLNGCFAIIAGDMQQNNANEVRIQVERAQAMMKGELKPTRNAEAALEFLGKCNEIASRALSADDRKANRQREMQILSVMDEQQRVETRVLFKRMATVPHGRRFSVLPKKAAPMGDQCERRSRRQMGLTVVKGNQNPLPAPRRSSVAGFQIFDI